jgi:hypothetical protein
MHTIYSKQEKGWRCFNALKAQSFKLHILKMGCVHNKRLYFIKNSVYMQFTIIVNRNALRASQPTPPVWACGNVYHIHHYI